ncbi:hypothetical protein ACJRO7_036264 [Eucalyptus globulus]|uniref:Uncharacterized protein n=1 Tax=Eucalyptus globulus TaxID=34317 RepID=A0ABD3JA58_EUCGL
MKMMKMMKAVKKLKLWTKRKRTKLQSRTSTNTTTITTTLITSSSGDCCPLLPMHSAADIQTETEAEITVSSSSTYWTPSAVPSAPPLPPWLVLEHEYPEHAHEQRFNFAYSCPPQPREEAIADLTTFRHSGGGMIGCVVQFGIHVFRCFCPCFHVRDPHPLPKLHAN